MGTIQYVGLDDADLDAFKQKQLEDLSEKKLERLQFMVKNDFDVVLHAKAYDQGGDRRKHSVNLRVNFPGGRVTAGKDDWDFLVAVKQAFDAVEQQLQTRFKV